jgi:hypothetical protein
MSRPLQPSNVLMPWVITMTPVAHLNDIFNGDDANRISFCHVDVSVGNIFSCNVSAGLPLEPWTVLPALALSMTL